MSKDKQQWYSNQSEDGKQVEERTNRQSSETGEHHARVSLTTLLIRCRPTRPKGEEQSDQKHW